MIKTCLDVVQKLLSNILGRKQGRIFGISAVIVDAKDEQAVNFYKHFGFVAFPEKKHRLFLPLNTIKLLSL